MKRKAMVGPARFRIVLLATLALLMVAASGWAAGPAPDFTLKAVQDSKDYSLSQYRGKVVLLNFFTFFCGPCREEMPHLSQIDQELKAQVSKPWDRPGFHPRAASTTHLAVGP